MFYKIVKELFSNLFGRCNPVAINDWDNLLQIKYNLAEMEAETIYKGLLRLKKRYQNSEYRVRVLVVYPNILQVIVGTEEEVMQIGNTDFKIEIC